MKLGNVVRRLRTIWKSCRLQHIIITAILVLAFFCVYSLLSASSVDDLIIRQGEVLTHNHGEIRVTKAERKLNLTLYDRIINEMAPSADDVIVNASQFNYIINEKDICSKRPIDLLIYVYTALENIEFRQMIRKTWGNHDLALQLNYTVIFVLGKSNNGNIMKHIKRESERHRDIMQEDYIDSYRNLSLKGLSALKWVSAYCANAPLVLKIDDDIIPNIYQIKRFIIDFGPLYKGRNLVFGLLHTAMRVERNKTSKVYIPEQKFKSNHFPGYCAGAAYLLTDVAVKAIYDVSFGVPYLHLEDVFITGILGRIAGTLRGELKGEYEFRDLYLLALCAIQKQMPNNIWFGFARTPDMMRQMWDCIKSSVEV